MVVDECAACGAVRVLAACLVGRVPCPRCAVYVCGHVRVSERPTCPVTGCNGRGPREVGGAVVLASSPAPRETGPSDLHLYLPAREACGQCGTARCSCWPVAGGAL